MTEAITPDALEESLPVLALAPVEPPEAPDDDRPPDEPVEPVTEELPSAPVPDDELPMAPDEVVLEPVLDEPEVPDSDEPDEPDDDEPGPLEPMLPVEPALPMLEPVAGLLLDDELPDRLPDEPALADEPLPDLFRLLDLSSLPKLD